MGYGDEHQHRHSYEQGLTRDAGAAAKLVKRLPALFDAIASGELHLTGLLMLGPHLTEANLLDVLARAKHRTKKEIAKLVRTLSPLPDVPPRIEPLGPAPARTLSTNATPGWDDFVKSMVPVRELTEGDRPRDWTGDTSFEEVPDADVSLPTRPKPTPATPARPTASKSVESAPLTGPQRYVVQFTTTDEYVKLVERAQALLSNTLPTAALEQLHMRAMRALVAELFPDAVLARAARCSVSGRATNGVAACGGEGGYCVAMSRTVERSSVRKRISPAHKTLDPMIHV